MYKNIKIGAKFWDEKNAREIEVLSFNGTGYHCKTITGVCDDDPGEEDYQWFTRQELQNMTEAAS